MTGNNGIINLDKPPFVSSMDVVRSIKRLTNEKKVGHGGTLDPSATGVLAICFGHAARMMDFLINEPKKYLAEVEFGKITDTLDGDGKTLKLGDTSNLNRENIEAALKNFVGFIPQVPPMYSAIRRRGRRLYEFARKGIDVQREARKVHISEIKIEDWTPPLLKIEIGCGRGVYIRSLAHDLGQYMGCGAYLKSLIRLASGPFKVEKAVSMQEFEKATHEKNWTELLHPADVVIQNLRSIVVNNIDELSISNGRQLSHSNVGSKPFQQEKCRIYTEDGQLLAIAKYDRLSSSWRPQMVFPIKRDV